MRKTLEELVEDMVQYLLGQEHWHSDSDECPPRCPLCYQRDCDYTGLTDAQVAAAALAAEAELSSVYGLDFDQGGFGWGLVDCIPSWRDRRSRNFPGQSRAERLESIAQTLADQGETELPIQGFITDIPLDIQGEAW